MQSEHEKNMNCMLPSNKAVDSKKDSFISSTRGLGRIEYNKNCNRKYSPDVDLSSAIKDAAKKKLEPQAN